jgi:hypothetical protein
MPQTRSSRTGQLRPAVIGEATAAVVVAQPGTALPLSYRSTKTLRAGLEPATCRLGVDNRNRSGPQQRYVAVVSCGRIRGVEPHGPKAALPVDNRAAPARDDRVVGAGPPGVEPGPARLELAVLPFTPQAYEKRTTRIERASPEWRSDALPSELRPRSGTPGWNRTSGLCRRRTALSPLSYGRTKEPPAGVEPAPRPYKGRVLAVDTTEAKMETVGVEPTSSSLQARRSAGLSYIPDADGWSRTTTARGDRVTAC